ncbi:MAG: class I SAM-dependent methyltransferase [Myxococcota bacterium]|nr:class I SAM-dependent methyltransferase [Deltaproteobacteria bacterium]MDQ3339028.1 class I SAM-dependent methyltransferase [Myxococcota bacterium]
MNDVRDSKERAWREVAAIDAAYERGEIDDAGWHRAMADLIVPAYLAGDVRRGSGHSGSAEDWDYSRGIVSELVARDRSLTFLDVGCANGLLMESIARWCPNVEPYGLDISPELAARARERLPHWADRIFVGNALGWQSPRRFDIVRTGLEYVPQRRRQDLVKHLLGMTELLIIGKFGEEIEDRAIERDLRAWGFEIVRTVERPHRNDARICYRAIGVRSPVSGCPV